MERTVPIRRRVVERTVSIQNSFLADLTDSISNPDLLTSEISYTIVLNALDQLKKGKSDGSSVFSDAFILAKDILSNSFESTFHCCCKTLLCSQALKKLYSSASPKPGKDLTCSGNYRLIALGQTLSNILEWCILLIYRALSPPHLFNLALNLTWQLTCALRLSSVATVLFVSLMPQRHSIESVTSSYTCIFSKLLEKNSP